MARKRRMIKRSLWYCPMCEMSGEAESKVGARNGMLKHFLSNEHAVTSERRETLRLAVNQDLHRRLAARRRI